jgi:hypothetical protein
LPLLNVVLGLHPEHLGDEDREGHHRATAALHRPRDDRAGAVGLELDERAGGLRERRPPATRDPDRLVRGQLLPIADQLAGALERLGRPDGIEDLPRRPLVALVDDVAAAQLDGIQPDLTRDGVEVLLEGPADLWRRGRAHGAGRRVVRVHEVGLDRDVRHAVGTDGVHRSELREERGIGRVRAVVDHELAAAREQRAVAGDRGLELDRHPLASMVGHRELLAAREDELDRAAGCPREGGDVCLEVGLALAAEAAAEEGHDHADPRLRQLQRVGHGAPCREGHLGR